MSGLADVIRNLLQLNGGKVRKSDLRRALKKQGVSDDAYSRAIEEVLQSPEYERTNNYIQKSDQK